MQKHRHKFIKDCYKKLINLRDHYTKVVNSPTKEASGNEDSERSIHLQHSQTSTLIREKMRKTLPEIERAILKIKKGTYGICERTGQLIDQRRLKAVPWARVNISN